MAGEAEDTGLLDATTPGTEEVTEAEDMLLEKEVPALALLF